MRNQLIFSLCVSLLSTFILNGQSINYSSEINITNPSEITYSGAFDISGEDTSPIDMAFNNDGTKLFVIGGGASEVNQYSLATPYVIISGVSFDGTPYDLTSQETGANGIAFNSDGTKMYILGANGEAVYQYSLATPFDITSGVTYDGTPFDISADGDLPRSITFSNDGSKMFIVEQFESEVNQYSLTTPFDITSGVSLDVPFDVSSEESGPFGADFNKNGTRMFITGGDTDDVYQYNLANPFDLSSGVTFAGSPLSVTNNIDLPQGILFNETGTRMYIIDLLNVDISQYELDPIAFRETSVNNGSVEGSIIVSLTGETFTNAGAVLTSGVEYTIDNLPAGLVPFMEVVADGSSATLTFSSNATSNINTDDIGGLQFTFSDGAFVGGSAAAVTNAVAANSGLGIDFDNQPNLDYATPIDLATAVITGDGSAFDLSAEVISPEGLTFNPDGTKMYIIGQNEINQYTLTTPYDITSGVSFDGTPFSLADHGINCADITYNVDGTILLVVCGNPTRQVNQYSLSTPFDITSGVTFADSLIILAEESDPRGFAFRPDGKKMFVVGIGGNEVNQYNLTNPFDISEGATFDGSPFSISTETTNALDISFNADGSKMYILDVINDIIIQYSLGSNYETRSAVTYDNESFNFSSQEGNARGTAFNPSGTKFYTVGTGTSTVSQFSISANVFTETALNDGSVDGSMIIVLTGDSFINAGGSLALGTDYTVDNLPSGLFSVMSVSNLGNSATLTLTGNATANNDTNDLPDLRITFENNAFTNVAAVNITNAIGANTGLGIDFNQNPELIYASPINISNGDITFDGSPFDLSGEDTGIQDMTFNNSGTKMYVVGQGTHEVNQYSLSIPFETTSGVTADGSPLSISAQETLPQGITFSTDGTKFFLVGFNSLNVNQYSVPTPFDITSGVTFDGTPFDLSGEIADPKDIMFNPDGTKMYILDGSFEVNQYSLTTPFDITSGVSFDGTPFDLSGEEINPSAFSFNGDGSRLFVIGGSSRLVNQYTLATPYDITTGMTADGNPFDVFSEQGTPGGLAFSKDGRKMFISGNSLNEINQYSLGTTVFQEVPANDGSLEGSIILHIENETFTNAGSTMTSGVDYTIDNLPAGLTPTLSVATDGKSAKLTLSGNASSNNVSDSLSSLQFTFTNTAFSGGNVSIINNAVAANSGLGISFLKNPVLTYAVSPDVSTATYTGNFFSVLAEQPTPAGFTFNNDGSKMYLLGFGSNDVSEYTLSTPFDLTTATYRTGLDVSAQETGTTGLAFNNDGTKLFISGTNGEAVFQYLLDTAFSISSATYTNIFSVSAQETNPRDLAFNTDGSKMFVLGLDVARGVIEYNLGTPFEITTSTFSSILAVNAEESTPLGLEFNKDGSKMYVTGSINDMVNEYNLTTPFDLTSATFSTSFSVASEETSPSAIAFDNTGLHMYIVGFDSARVFEYGLSNIAFREVGLNDGAVNGSLIITLEGETFTNAGGSLTSGVDFTVDNLPSGLVPNLAVSSSGLTATLTLSGNASPHSESEDLADLQFTFSNSAFTGGIASNVINAVAGNSGLNIDFDSSTETDILSFSFPEEYYPAAIDNISHVVDISVVPGTDLSALAATFSLSTGAAAEISAVSQTSGVTVNDFSSPIVYTIIAEDGITAQDWTVTVNLIIPSITYATTREISDLVLVDSLDVSAESLYPQGIEFSMDGMKLFVLGDDVEEVNEYDLASPFDIGSPTFITSLSLTETEPTGFTFSNDGKQLFMVGSLGDSIYHYALNKPYDLSTTTYVSAKSIFSETDVPTDVIFNRDGSKIYVLGWDNASVYEYDLSTNYDIATLSYLQEYSIIGEEGNPHGMRFSPDGSKLYVVGDQNDELLEYDLATNYDVSTLSFVRSIYLGDRDNIPTGIVFDNSGTKLFFTGTQNARIYEYDLGNIAFKEITPNNGNVEGSINISIFSETFNNPGGSLTSGVDFSIDNLPAGLVPNLSISADGFYGILTISGNTSNSDLSDNVSDLQFTFQNGAFAGGNAPLVQNAIGANSGLGIAFNEDLNLQDSLALVALYDSTNGPGWTQSDNWLSGPVNTWFGVSITGSRVTSVILSNNNLAGTLPAEIGDLTALNQLILNDNLIADTIPSQIGYLSSLTYLSLRNNQLIGVIPPTIGDITSLTQLLLDGNDLSGVVPANFVNLTGLNGLHLNNNQLVDLPDLSALPLTDFYVQSNLFTFEDLEPNISILDTYAPQGSVGSGYDTLVNLGESPTFDAIIGGANNTFEWFKDGVLIPGETSVTLTLPNVEFPDEGDYHFGVSNTIVTGLTILGAPVTLKVSSLERDSLVLHQLYLNTAGIQWTNASNWTVGNIDTWEGVQLGNNRIIGLDISGKNVQGSVIEDLTDIVNLETINLSNNVIRDIPDLSVMTSLTSLNVSGNNLGFDDLEPNISISTFEYQGQGPVGDPMDTLLARGSDYTISFSAPGSANAYQWRLNGNALSGETGTTYFLDSINYTNMGVYSVDVTNSIVPDLTLTSQALQVLATSQIAITVFGKDNVLIDAGSGNLLKIADPGTPFDTIATVVPENGKFIFDITILGDYLVALEAEDTIYLPTYYENTFLWEEADTLRFRSDLLDTMYMTLKPRPLTPADGEYTFTGIVETDFPDGGRIDARQRLTRTGCSVRRFRGAGRATEDAWELVAYVYTDDNGEFEFNFLPAALYRFNIEYPGIPMDPESFVEFELGAGEKPRLKTEVLATITESGIFVEEIPPLGIEDVGFFKIYPNPADQYMMIEFQKSLSKIEIRIIDLNGKVVHSKRDNNYLNKYRIDLDKLSNGLHLLQIIDVKNKLIETRKIYIYHK
ncbi:MAG: T9SS type A sorting domain-containing protein [Bacteroidota bacterium]